MNLSILAKLPSAKRASESLTAFTGLVKDTAILSDMIAAIIRRITPTMITIIADCLAAAKTVLVLVAEATVQPDCSFFL